MPNLFGTKFLWTKQRGVYNFHKQHGVHNFRDKCPVRHTRFTALTTGMLAGCDGLTELSAKPRLGMFVTDRATVAAD